MTPIPRATLTRAWYDCDTPDTEPLPCGYETALTPLQRLCVLRCLRVDRVPPAVTRYVATQLDERYIRSARLQRGGKWRHARAIRHSSRLSRRAAGAVRGKGGTRTRWSAYARSGSMFGGTLVCAQASRRGVGRKR